MRRLRSHLSYANVMATVAVFVALGGGAYAVSSVPDNSVGTKQLKNSAVTTVKLANGALTATKVKNHSLLAEDFKAGQLPGPPLWAVVAASGAEVRGSHVTAVTKLFSGVTAGSYQVTFDRDVASCALLATLGRTDAQNLDPDPGEIGTAYRNGNPDAVYVKTRDSTGTSADASFHLAVFC